VSSTGYKRGRSYGHLTGTGGTLTASGLRTSRIGGQQGATDFRWNWPTTHRSERRLRGVETGNSEEIFRSLEMGVFSTAVIPQITSEVDW
jgi:hypothetical protein